MPGGGRARVPFAGRHPVAAKRKSAYYRFQGGKNEDAMAKDNSHTRSGRPLFSSIEKVNRKWSKSKPISKFSGLGRSR